MPETIQIPALFAFEEDIRTRSWTDWLVAHISFLKPLHRYEGNIFLEPAMMTLSGKDRRKGAGFEERILKRQVLQLYHGFDEIFTVSETRGLGLGGRPLRITYDSLEGERRIYLITNYRMGTWDNTTCFEILKQWAG